MTTSRISLDFFVDGRPGPKGSMRGMLDGKGQPIAVPSYSKTAAAWERAVRKAARTQMVERSFGRFARAFCVSVDFFMSRPNDDFVGNDPKNRLRPDSLARPSKDPDIDKLLRATLDGLTTKLPKEGSDQPVRYGVWGDDNTVITANVREFFGDPESREIFGFSKIERYGARIVVEEVAATIADVVSDRGIQGALAL